MHEPFFIFSLLPTMARGGGVSKGLCGALFTGWAETRTLVCIFIAVGNGCVDISMNESVLIERYFSVSILRKWE